MTDAAERASWPPTFHGSPWIPFAFLVAFALWALLSNSLLTWLFGADPSTLITALWTLPSGVVQFGVVLLVVRVEGVELRALGLWRRQLRQALIAVTGVLVAVNIVVAGFVLFEGDQVALDPFGLYRSAPLEYSASALVATGLAQYVFVGLIEELAFRGYLQNKLTALQRHRSVRFRTAAAIVMTAGLFAMVHIPALLLVDGASLGQTMGTLVLLTLSGVTFGTVYALTQSLFLVAFLHGIGNFWPLIVDPGVGVWPNWGVIIILYGLVVVLYRRWTELAVEYLNQRQPRGVAVTGRQLNSGCLESGCETPDADGCHTVRPAPL